MKPLFEERMKILLIDSSDFQKYSEIIHTGPRNFIRCNTLKINTEDLMKRLSKKWKVKQLFENYPEIILIDQDLKPGELGNAIEHVLGYYYVQELSSMLSVLALDPKPGEFILDVCASPGSKTSQIAARMENKGTLIANDIKMDRVRILASNLERSGISNTIITRKDGVALCSGLSKKGYKFDRILLDAPCSGEGTLRSSPKTFLMWNIKVVENLSRMQKKLLAHALKALKKDGVLVYSTCTHSPEENEAIIDFALKNFPVKVESIHLPIKSRPGINSWKEENYNSEVKKTCRIYPQDNDTEGFFVSKITLLEEVQ
jgi:NOL1/NOP2/sun family putative RNA methylase